MGQSYVYLAVLVAVLSSLCYDANALPFFKTSKEDKAVVLVANNPVLKQLDPEIFKSIAENNHLVIFNRAELWQQLGASLRSYSISFYSPNTIRQFSNEVGDQLIPAACGADKILVLKGVETLNKAFGQIEGDPKLQGDPPSSLGMKENFLAVAVWTAQVLRRCGTFDEFDAPPELTYSKRLQRTYVKKKAYFPTSGFQVLGYYLSKNTPNLVLLGFNSTAPGYNGARGHNWIFETEVINLLAELGRVQLWHNAY